MHCQYRADSKQLSEIARTIIATEEKNGANIFVSAISLVEVVYLAERGRLPSAALQSLEDAFSIYYPAKRNGAGQV